MLVNCKNCGKEFKAPPSRVKRVKNICCSSKCSMLFRRKQPDFVQPKKQDTKITLNCAICNSEFKVSPYREEIAKTCSRKCHYRYLAQQFKGEGGPAWKGGASTRTKEDRKWANSVIERDQECTKCGCKNDLQAHHVEHFALNILSRLDLNNGITLCVDCHSKEHPELPSSFIVKSDSKGKSIKTCPQCKTTFIAKKSKQKFCSRTCNGAFKKNGNIVNCAACGNQIYRPKDKLTLYTASCCSRRCAAKYGKEKIKEEKLNNL